MLRKTKESGITLIALIISIIILVILAAVSINAVYNSKIIDYAVNGTQNYVEAAKKEELQLKYVEAYIQPSWNGTVGEGFAGGDGSQGNPYKITNGEELAYFAKAINEGNAEVTGAYVVLDKSINLGNREFTPIGKSEVTTRGETDWVNVTNYFDGTFDGQGNVITGLKITEETIHGVGLFGVLGANGTIKNVTISEGTVIGRAAVGGIAGASKGTIIGCRNNAEVIAKDNTDVSNSGQQAGGIVGFVTKGSITGCINDGRVTAKDESMKDNRGKCAGGIIGQMILEENMTIANCTNNGKVLSQFQYAGGILGRARYSGDYIVTINNCRNTGKIEAVPFKDDFSSAGSGYTAVKVGYCRGNLSGRCVEVRLLLRTVRMKV